MESEENRLEREQDPESYIRPQLIVDKLHLGTLIVEHNQILNSLQVDIIQLIKKMFSDSGDDFSKSKDNFGIFSVCIKHIKTTELKDANRFKLDSSLKIIYDIWTKKQGDRERLTMEVVESKLPERLKQIKADPNISGQLKATIMSKINYILTSKEGFAKL